MDLDLPTATALLGRTPRSLDALLRGLPEAWIRADEGPDTWSAFDVVGHLIHGERTDWIPRLRIVLEEGEARAFDPFDRFAQLRENRGKSLDALLDTFATLRAGSLRALEGFSLDDVLLARRGMHPELGAVTARQLLSTWVVHDLGHLRQIARVLAKPWGGAVGPWRAYLSILGD